MTMTRKLGDAEVFPIGLGGMPMSLSSRPESITDSAKAVDLELSHEELQAIGGIAQTA